MKYAKSSSIYVLIVGIMMMCTLIVNPRYYPQFGDLIYIIMLGVLIVLSILFLYIHLKYLGDSHNES
ncbi:MAG: hypothetical protein KAH14_03045 [Clostridiales bacterium]|nr:hypothetical protein [Clostridiales bacterium]